MKSIFKNAAISIILMVHLITVAIINFALPSYKTLTIVGTEVKRMDKDGFINKQRTANGVVRDVYFLYTKFPDSEKVISFRNEDTRWGFPFYMKFNSADLQARATAFAEEKTLVEVKYYGWRIPIFDEFFNAISVKKLENTENASHPIVSYILYFLTLVSFVSCIVFVNRKFRQIY
ncbi:MULTISPECIES: DUF1523 family protein [unclassified Campylobacter]|uniref:DUF1523 family protein n=1 Tax=unclassified Campylobacter TaxID=2593542 RepID=UPI003D332F59